MSDNDFWRNKRVLITGGTGFIGSHLTRHLVARGARVSVVSRSGLFRHGPPERGGLVSLKGDLRDRAVADECTRGQEVVIHLASKIAGLSYNQSHHAEMFSYNTVLDLQVLHAAVSNGARSFVFPSGTLVYDADTSAPIPETAPADGPPLASCQGASWAKRTLERAASLYRAEYDTQIWIVRFSNIYGPGDDFDSERAHLIGSVIRSVANDEAPPLWGDGSQLRSYLFIDDAIRALDLWLRRGTPEQSVNIGGQTEFSVREIVDRVIRISGKALTPVVEDRRPTGLKRKLLDVSRLRQSTGFDERTSLDEGLEICYRWYTSRSNVSTHPNAPELNRRSP